MRVESYRFELEASQAQYIRTFFSLSFAAIGAQPYIMKAEQRIHGYLLGVIIFNLFLFFLFFDFLFFNTGLGCFFAHFLFPQCIECNALRLIQLGLQSMRSIVLNVHIDD